MSAFRYIFPIFCIYGYSRYISGCPTNCASCNSNTKQCKRCEDGYWLNYNYCNQCPSGCAECSNYNYCTKCKKDYWNTNTNCNSRCYGYCDDNGCEDVTGHCHQCKSGYYGPHCYQKCELCKNQSCGLRQCTDGCIDGYYKLISSDTISCRKCYQNCYVCKNNTYCLECNKGFFKYNITDGSILKTYCFQCKQNCVECTDYSKCTVCNPGTYGTSCEKRCSLSNCYRCTGSDDFENCTECKLGYKLHGNKCVLCESKNGQCLEKCTNEFWGEYCNKTCPESCASCNQTNGYCEVCHRNKYGESCQYMCSEHCVDDGSILHVCSNKTGECEFGCEDGYSGDRCDIAPTTLSSDISRTTTTTTTAEKSDITETLVESNKRQTELIVGTAAGGSALIISVLIIVIVCVVRRRKKQCKDDPQECHVDDRQSETGHDYIYAQPIKHKKSIHHNKEEISGPQGTYENVVIDLNTEDNAHEDNVTQETDIDTILLENIDDEPKSVHVTDMNIPDSDTYCNMIGLKRSRVKISELFGYIRDKEDFENEFEKLPQGLTRTCNEALKRQNRAKNRYNGIYAYDATRVVLQSTNFINANYIDGQFQSQHAYIASLGPTKSTMNKFVTFWEMVWQEKSNKIVMLTNLEESKKMKCEQYWPKLGSRASYGDFTVGCTAENSFADFVVREFTVEHHLETRNVTHYQYTAWPDKTVPHTVSSLIEFRDKVEQGKRQVAGPMIVHCSAGIGRTGTYIALDILIREGRKDGSVDIFGCVIGLRGQRVSLVQNAEQYIFLHHCVAYALICEPDTLPIATIPHYMTKEKIGTQYQSFQNLVQLASKEKRLARHAKSRKENRKGSDIPDDNYRVRLTLSKHDYINAVYVNGYEEKNKFFLAQTPLPNTVEDFLSMLYQERCSLIVCLDEENTKDKSVAQYIPPANKVLTFGHFQIAFTKSDSKEDFIIRDLKISRIGSPSEKDLKIRHYQFKGWKGSDIVPETIPFLNLIADVEKARKSMNPQQPIAVHCLTGSERSGLFNIVSVLQEKMAVETEMSILNTICQVRSRRQSVVQDIELLRFCYKCVEEMLEMPDTNTYCNISDV